MNWFLIIVCIVLLIAINIDAIIEWIIVNVILPNMTDEQKIAWIKDGEELLREQEEEERRRR